MIFLDLFMMMFPYILIGSIIMAGVWLFRGEEPIESKLDRVEQKADQFEEYLDNKFKPQDEIIIAPSDGYTR